MRLAELRSRMDALYKHYDHRFVDPDPLEFVRRQTTDADREVVGLIASALAYGNVKQIKRSISRVVDVLGDRPAETIDRLAPEDARRRLGRFKHRFNDARDVACLLHFIRQMREANGSIEGFFLSSQGGHSRVIPDGRSRPPLNPPSLAAALRAPSSSRSAAGDLIASFSERALALDHGGLYGRRRLPSSAGVRFFFPSPRSGSACKRLNLYLRWMVRRDGVDLGVWRGVDPASLVIPLDAHIYTIARRVGLTRYRSPGWPMAVDITRRLRRLDPRDPVKYDFAFHRMGLWKREEEIRSLRARPSR
jgi:uncharacterized protein (TIGR02757 family)